MSTHGQMRLTCNKVRFEAAFALAIRESESCLSCTTATLIQFEVWIANVHK